MIFRLREKKEKHVWSVQIMNELLKHASMYEYENTGASPQAVLASTHSRKDDCETKPYEIVDGGDATFASMLGLPDPIAMSEGPPKNGNKPDNEAGKNGKAKDDKDNAVSFTMIANLWHIATPIYVLKKDHWELC